VVVDLVSFPDASVVDGLSFDRVERGVREATGTLRRFRIPVAGGRVSDRTLATDVALPRTSPAARRRPYRYAYAQRTGAGEFTGVTKVDVERAAERVWTERGCFAGEPVFVPRGTERGERDGEADGVVCSVVLDRDAERSFLLLLDGETFEEVGRAWLPHALPLGFHGEYFG
jgi:carotenoid cleavage dioxygenase-like enzyme